MEIKMEYLLFTEQELAAPHGVDQNGYGEAFSANLSNSLQSSTLVIEMFAVETCAKLREENSNLVYVRLYVVPC